MNPNSDQIHILRICFTPCFSVIKFHPLQSIFNIQVSYLMAAVSNNSLKYTKSLLGGSFRLQLMQTYFHPGFSSYWLLRCFRRSVNTCWQAIKNLYPGMPCSATEHQGSFADNGENSCLMEGVCFACPVPWKARGTKIAFGRHAHFYHFRVVCTHQLCFIAPVFHMWLCGWLLFCLNEK